MGGRYLYWCGKASAAQEANATLPTAASLTSNLGHWVIATAIDQAPGGSGCLAYVEDVALAPHQVSQGTSWRVGFEDLDSRTGDLAFRPSDTLRLVLQEWND